MTFTLHWETVQEAAPRLGSKPRAPSSKKALVWLFGWTKMVAPNQRDAVANFATAFPGDKILRVEAHV